MLTARDISYRVNSGKFRMIITDLPLLAALIHLPGQWENLPRAGTSRCTMTGVYPFPMARKGDLLFPVIHVPPGSLSNRLIMPKRTGKHLLTAGITLVIKSGGMLQDTTGSWEGTMI
jgi:hypothetical protein